MKTLLWLILPLLLLSVGCELTSAPHGRIVHLAIALSYRGSDVQSLPAAINDGEELALAFGDLFCDRLVIGQQLIWDGDGHASETADLCRPTKEAVISHIALWVAALDSNDLLIISYSGHGLEDGSLVLAPESHDGALLLEDGTLNPLLILTVEELLSLLVPARAATLLLLDSCYSGNFITPTGSSISTIGTTEIFAAAWRRYASGATPSNCRLFVLGATTADHTSFEPLAGSHTHGYFTRALLEGLGWDCTQQRLTVRRPLITADWLYAYILANQRLPSTSEGGTWYQHPTIGGGPMELVLIKR